MLYKQLRYLLISLALFQFSCSDDTPDGGFNLKIKIKGEVGKYAILQYLHPEGERIDTSFVDDGVIKFRGRFLGPQLVELQFPEISKKTSLFVENKRITVSADIASLANLEVDGTSLHAEYKTMLTTIQSAVDSADYYDSLYIVYNNPEYELKYNIFKNIEQTNIRKFIAGNRSSPVSLYALVNNFANAPSYVEVNSLYESLDSNLRLSSYGKYFYNEILLPAKKTAIGMEAPDFRFVDNKGDSISLSSLRGKYVLLDFWTSWSLPCVEFNDELKMLSAAYEHKGFNVVQVSLEKNTANWKKAIEEQGLSWLNYSDGMAYSSPIAKLYGVKSIPYNILIDDKGEIIAKNVRGQMLQYQCWRLFGDL